MGGEGGDPGAVKPAGVGRGCGRPGQADREGEVLQSFLVFQKIADEQPAVWFPLCRL